MENETILTVKQAMAELHISNFTYYHLVKSGKLKQIKVTAGKRGVLRSEMNRYKIIAVIGRLILYFISKKD